MHPITRRSALALPALFATPALAQSQQLVIGTGTTGGVYFPARRRAGQLLSRAIPGTSATAEVTGRAPPPTSSCSAPTGRRSSSARWTPRWTASAAPASSAAASTDARHRRALHQPHAGGDGRPTATSAPWPDLKGKRISTGAPQSATELFALRLIAAAGLKFATDFRGRERLSPAESTNAIRDNKIDAYFFVSGVPTSAITDLAPLPAPPPS
jgi:hypothetical protein